MDSYLPGGGIRYFAIEVKLRDARNCKQLRREIYFGGVEDEPFITITRDPESLGLFLACLDN